MHYITGTRISIAPDPKRGFRSKECQFNVNTIYTLSGITRISEGFNYTFISSDRNRVDVTFTSTRAADRFIANLRKETIPDYDNKSDSNDF